MNRERKPGEAGDQTGQPAGDGEPVRLRDAAGAHAPPGLADALAGAAQGHRPTGAQLDELRRSLAAALPTPGGGAAPRSLNAGWWALVGALLVVGAGALWYRLADRTTASPTVPAAVPVAATPPAPEAARAAVELPALPPPLQKGRPPTAPGRAGRGGDELRLLTRAQQALVEDPALALALAARHGRLFPDGALVQEREVIAIEALRRLHRTDQAEARARQFRARYPHSAHLPRVEGLRP